MQLPRPMPGQFVLYNPTVKFQDNLQVPVSGELYQAALTQIFVCHFIILSLIVTCISAKVVSHYKSRCLDVLPQLPPAHKLRPLGTQVNLLAPYLISVTTDTFGIRCQSRGMPGIEQHFTLKHSALHASQSVLRCLKTSRCLDFFSPTCLSF